MRALVDIFNNPYIEYGLTAFLIGVIIVCVIWRKTHLSKENTHNILSEEELQKRVDEYKAFVTEREKGE